MTLTPARKTIDIDGTPIPLRPGMAASVEVKTGKRRILECVLAPGANGFIGDEGTMTWSGARFAKEAQRLAQTQERRSNPVWLSALLLLCFFASTGTEALAQTDASPLNLPGQIGGRIAQCWKAPQTQAAQLIEVTVRLRFSSTGVVIGGARAVYVRAPAEPGLREKIVASILPAVKTVRRCRSRRRLGLRSRAGCSRSGSVRCHSSGRNAGLDDIKFMLVDRATCNLIQLAACGSSLVLTIFASCLGALASFRNGR